MKAPNNLLSLPLLAMALFALTPSRAWSGDAPLGPIQKVEIGKNREFLVNGKPFFPLMSWAQSPKAYGRLPNVGFNVHCGTSDPDAAAATGCYAIPGFKAEWVKHPNVFAFIHGDEPDMPQKGTQAPRHSPQEVAAEYQKILEADKMHPVFVTFTGNFTRDSKYTAETKAKLYPEFIKSCTVAGFDIYPIYGSGKPADLLQVADGVSQLRELAGPTRPVYAWIETSKGSKWMTYEKQPEVLPMHTRSEVWMAIIRGATAIGYFTHAWKPSFKEFAPTPEMQTELKRLNSQITRLAPAILAPPATAKIEMKLGGGLGCHFKATTSEGSLWIFAENIDLGEGADKLQQFDPIHPRGGSATFTIPDLKAGTKVEVVDEDRSLTATAGGFTDAFEPLAVHIYRVKTP